MLRVSLQAHLKSDRFLRTNSYFPATWDKPICSYEHIVKAWCKCNFKPTPAIKADHGIADTTTVDVDKGARNGDFFDYVSNVARQFSSLIACNLAV